MTNIVQGIVVPIVVIVGLIVLVALHDLAANVAVPVIVGLAGVHIGLNNGPTATTPTSSSPTNGPVIQ